MRGDTDSIIYSDVVSISTTIGNTITEVDTGNSKGIAITDASSSNGHWEYSADGVNNWTQISGVATDTALLLDESYSLRFASTGPDGVTAADIGLLLGRTDSNSSKLSLRYNSHIGTADFELFFSSSNSLSLEVTDLNDVELAVGVTMNLGSITEDDAPATDAPAYSSLTTFSGVSVVGINVYTRHRYNRKFQQLGYRCHRR